MKVAVEKCKERDKKEQKSGCERDMNTCRLYIE
jgi:hypothetical protein